MDVLAHLSHSNKKQLVCRHQRHRIMSEWVREKRNGCYMTFNILKSILFYDCFRPIGWHHFSNAKWHQESKKKLNNHSHTHSRSHGTWVHDTIKSEISMVRFGSRLFTVLSILFVINYDNYGLDESCPKWITSTYYFVLCLLSLCDSEHGIKCRTKSRNMKLMWLLIRSLLLLFFSSSQIQSRYKQKITPYYLHIRWVTQTLWFRWALDLFLFIFVFLYSLSLPSTKCMSIALHCIAYIYTRNHYELLCIFLFKKWNWFWIQCVYIDAGKYRLQKIYSWV